MGPGGGAVWSKNGSKKISRGRPFQAWPSFYWVAGGSGRQGGWSAGGGHQGHLPGMGQAAGGLQDQAQLSGPAGDMSSTTSLPFTLT